MKLVFRYVYTFYRFGEEEFSDVGEESFPVASGCRFALNHQEDGTFQTLEVTEEKCILVFPNKDQLLLPLAQEAELAYDEEGNTEQHKVLIITTDKGRTSKLYPAWE